MIALYTFCNPSLISRTSRGRHEFSGRVGLDEREPAVILGRRPAGRPQFSFVMRRSGWGRNDSPVIHGAGACTEPDLVLYNRRQREPHPGGGWLVNFGISMAVTRLQRAEGVPTERMSPELVLVSPDLAGSARASLSDCPWEAFLPQQPPPAAVVLAPEPRRVRRMVRRALPFAWIATFLAAVVVGSILPVRDGPTLARADSSPAAFQPLSQGFFVPRTHTTQLRGRAARTSPAASAGPAGSTRAARAVAAVDVTSANPHLRFAIDPRRHMITRFEGTFRCAGHLTLTNTGIRYDGTFAVSRRFGGRDRVTIWLAGRVDSGLNVHGTFRALHGGCDTGPVTFRARAIRR